MSIYYPEDFPPNNGNMLPAQHSDRLWIPSLVSFSGGLLRNQVHLHTKDTFVLTDVYAQR